MSNTHISQRRLEWLLRSCQQIVASDGVWQFVVGISSNHSNRRAAYDRWARTKKGEKGTLDGFVLLEWNLTGDQAILVERYLFENLVHNDKYGTIKMHYYPSVKRGLERNVVYLAWWSEWLVDAGAIE